MDLQRIAIIQPSLFPWRGYFRIISRCNLFVFFDDVQFDKRGWRNRNRLLTTQGPQWFTIPVVSKGRYLQKINETQISYEDSKWPKKLLQTIQTNYGKAPYFKTYFPWLEELFSKNTLKLDELTIQSTIDVCHFMNIKPHFLRSSELSLPESIEKVDRLITICKHFGATHYLSGPSAKDYIGDGQDFLTHQITLEYQSYDLPTYPQMHQPFFGEASILDLLFNTGPDAFKYI